jgi:hypothetical protein
MLRNLQGENPRLPEGRFLVSLGHALMHTSGASGAPCPRLPYALGLTGRCVAQTKAGVHVIFEETVSQRSATSSWRSCCPS